jgi:Mg2+ and Co2+ transporter CorA
MNVRFPGYETTAGLLGSLVGMVLIVAMMLAFFRYKRWL